MERAISKKAVDRAGDVLRQSTSRDEISVALSLVSDWRSLHYIPTLAIYLMLRHDVVDKDDRWKTALVASRMKRMKSIVRKLLRFKDMRISRMQDIGGVRVIMNTVADVYALHDYLMASKDTYEHELKLPPKDYIACPKPDGYRSLHQIFRYKNGQAPCLDGMCIELQIRTRLQHAWATAVETLGVLENTSFKTGEGNEIIHRFFISASALFAINEGQPIPEAYIDIPTSMLVKEFEEADKKLRIRERLNALSIQAHEITQTITSYDDGFLLLVLEINDNKGILQQSYIETKSTALDKYSYMEQLYKDKTNIIVLLLQIDDMRELRQAYPNYYLDTSVFLENIGTICDQYR